MQKFCILFITLTVANGLFLSDKIREKLFTQFLGFVKFIFDMEEEKPIHEDVTFHLYTRLDPNQGTKLILDDTQHLQEAQFIPHIKTVFIIHGYTDHKERDIIVGLRKAFLDRFDINIIVVDWKRLAGFIYFNAASHACRIGKYLAKFLQFLQKCNVDLANIHLIGHSLGAQISGIAGEILKGKIGRITGLDPAGPLFEFILTRNSFETLESTDALFVDVIHTAGNDFGITRPVGHVDFYPNNGISPQPGCLNLFTAVSCSHIRSVEYFIESINGSIPFLAKRCASFKGEFPRDCDTKYFIPMGYFTPREARGIFYLKTNPEPPFAKRDVL